MRRLAKKKLVCLKAKWFLTKNSERSGLTRIGGSAFIMRRDIKRELDSKFRVIFKKVQYSVVMSKLLKIYSVLFKKRYTTLSWDDRKNRA